MMPMGPLMKFSFYSREHTKGGYPIPKWEELSNAFRVTLFPHPIFEKTTLGTKLGLSEEAIKILNYCKVPRSIVEIMNHLGFQNRSKFRTRYLNPLLEAKMLKMTIPEKSQSSKQEYIVNIQFTRNTSC
jgi:ATP-dependent DNA helicase RecG